MKRCGHSEWLALRVQQNETLLLESDRLQTLVNNLPDPENQHLRLLVLIGGVAKSAAIQILTSDETRRKPISGRRHDGDIHLHLGACRIFHETPTLVADGKLPYQLPRNKRSMQAGCHETVQHTLPRLREGVVGPVLDDAADDLYSRLICPFADVICFFSADFGGFKPIVRRLASWLEKGESSTLPKAAYPRVLVVAEASAPGIESDDKARDTFLAMLKEETTKDLTERFSALEVIAISPEGKASVQTYHKRLNEALMKASDRVRTNRVDTQTLFSARHFATFFQHACDHFSRNIREPFDFIRTSRVRNPIAVDLEKHLSNFLKNIKSPLDLKEFAAPVIASSFLLDHYPPGMHAFDPRAVFRTLYRDICYRVSRTGVLVHDGSADMVLPSGFIKMIEDQLERCFVDGAGIPSATVHSNNLQLFRPRWRNMRSDVTCFSCLRRHIESILPCGHAVCGHCPLLFGERSDYDRWVFEIPRCFLCMMEFRDVTLKIKPDNAGVVTLSIDGGGVRGIMPLQFLQVLQDRIGLPIPVQDNFDIAFGTSSGGLIILAMFINGWSVDDCANAFESLARQAFKPRGVSRIPVLSRIPIVSHILEFLVSYLADGLYPVEDLEAALRDVFGNNRSILDYSHATSIGAKVGLPVTTIRGTDSCIFTNYNGVGTRPQDCGYHLIHSEEGSRRIHLWEIARCGSAAPWYFRPKRIPGVGTFQDGALWKNNPVDVAVWEIPVVWPSIEKPDLVISLGTGSSKPHAQGPITDGPRGLWNDGFLPRSYRALMGLLSGKKIAETFKNGRRAQLKGRYFRFDTEIDGRETDLDNTSKMPELAARAREQFCKSAELDIVAKCIIASYFHFELQTEPTRANGRYSGSGYILCIFPRNSPALDVLLSQLSKGAARFSLDGHLIPGRIEDRSFIDEEGTFRKRIEFDIKDKMSICLKEGVSPPQHISGSPFLIAKMIKAQGFNDHFGRADHRKRTYPDGYEEPAKKRRRT